MTIESESDLSRAVWRKSSYSNGQGGACVEVAVNLPGFVGVRDSKDRHGPVLMVGRDEWQRFVKAIRACL